MALSEGLTRLATRAKEAETRVAEVREEAAGGSRARRRLSAQIGSGASRQAASVGGAEQGRDLWPVE